MLDEQQADVPLMVDCRHPSVDWSAQARSGARDGSPPIKSLIWLQRLDVRDGCAMVLPGVRRQQGASAKNPRQLAKPLNRRFKRFLSD